MLVEKIMLVEWTLHWDIEDHVDYCRKACAEPIEQSACKQVCLTIMRTGHP